MTDPERLKNHLLLDYMLRHNQRLLKSLVDNPAEVLARLGLPEDALQCPPRAHRAVRRAEAAVREIEALDNPNPIETMPIIADIISRHFASPYLLAKIPFGVRFEESQARDDEEEDGGHQDATYTGTATVQCTWSPGCGLDVDG